MLHFEDTIEDWLRLIAQNDAILVVKADPVTGEETAYFRRRCKSPGGNLICLPKGKTRDNVAKRLLDAFGTDVKVNEEIRKRKGSWFRDK